MAKGAHRVAHGSHAADEASTRRTFAVISHPDAGKSTLTEALLLHAQVIGEAGATHGKAGRRATVSDWMDMERARGISISSSALQFSHGGALLNLVDTPGHADFSEDTYRVLTAVDCAVMLLDAAKGMETQTMKLFEVCRARRIPIITVVNKWDRPGLEALELLDEIQVRTGMRPTPLTWPVGIAGDFHGVVDRATGDFIRFTRTAGGSTLAGQERLDPQEALAEIGQDWTTAQEEHELLSADDYDHDQDSFLAQDSTPVLFTAAALNFGVGQLLDVLERLAPSPSPRPDTQGRVRELDAPFSAQVFKVQAGMDRAHRDRLAFARVCSGSFERGEVVTHARTRRGFATKYVHSVMGRGRETLDTAHPGDIIGLVNAGDLRAGDTLYTGPAVSFPPIPPFAPEHFRVASPRDPSRYKQFLRGIDQLDQEGVIQVLRSERRPGNAPILAAVGPMQFEVASHRMESEFSCPVLLENLPYTLALATTAADAPVVEQRQGVEVAARSDGVLLALFADEWQVKWVRRDHPEVLLETIGPGLPPGTAPRQ
ncbi:peptide chain release factor 3 [Tessaracoccus sp. SD287]|nr:peptide chain release factor 3 [Tessaracoccus sp. SD287]